MSTNMFTADSIALEFGLLFAEERELEEHRMNGDAISGRDWLQVAVTELYGENHDVADKLDVLLRMVPRDDPHRQLIVKLRSASAPSLKEAKLAVEECKIELRDAQREVDACDKAMRTLHAPNAADESRKADETLRIASCFLGSARMTLEKELEINKKSTFKRRRVIVESDAEVDSDRISRTN